MNHTMKIPIMKCTMIPTNMDILRNMDMEVTEVNMAAMAMGANTEDTEVMDTGMSTAMNMGTGIINKF